MSAYVIVRTESAGCFAGTLTRRKGNEADLVSARRLWYWDGAASLSELAVSGPGKPKTCKFPAPVNLTVLGVIEVIEVTPEARAAIEAVPVWSAR